jgi:hypothetical protein
VRTTYVPPRASSDVGPWATGSGVALVGTVDACPTRSVCSSFRGPSVSAVPSRPLVAAINAAQTAFQPRHWRDDPFMRATALCRLADAYEARIGEIGETLATEAENDQMKYEAGFAAHISSRVRCVSPLVWPCATSATWLTSRPACNPCRSASRWAWRA